jgi:hypothetical protein
MKEGQWGNSLCASKNGHGKCIGGSNGLKVLKIN